MKELVKRYPEAKVKVVAPVPYFPSWLPINEYRQYSEVEKQEIRADIEVLHPKYLVIPKVGMNITPYFLYKSSLKATKNIHDSGFTIDVIDSHYFYPDGVVANWVGKKLNIPVMVTARGSDINVIPQNKIAKKRIVKALNEVEASAAVSQALVDEMVKLAPNAKPPVVLRNGVDLNVFHPKVTLPELPFKLASDEKLILSVGNLVELKGHHLVIEALVSLEKVKLIVIGEGEEEQPLKKLVIKLNLTERVLFTGNLLQSELPGYYAAADALVLASSREGMPNVLLEAIASGTPVVATNVGGSPEVLKGRGVGKLLSERDSKNIVEALTTLFLEGERSTELANVAKKLSWDEVSKKQYLCLQRISNKEP